MRALLALLADADSVLELRHGFAPGMITALLRLEGRPMGVIANNPMHLGGAIDAVPRGDGKQRSRHDDQANMIEPPFDDGLNRKTGTFDPGWA